MSQSKERMYEAEKAYQAMPHGPARLAAIRSAVRKADQQMDHYWRMQHRYREMLEQMFHGDQGMILPLAGQIVTMFEETPTRAFLNQYLYTLYAAVEVWDFLPQLPMEQWQDMMTHFWNAAQRYRCGHRQYYEIAFIRAIRQGRKEDAENNFQNWVNATTPDITSCKACKQYLRVFYAAECADAALASRMARPLLDGSLTCDQEPARTLGVLLDLALDHGDRTRAAQYAARLRGCLLKESKELKCNAPMLRWLAYEAPEDGLRMLARAVLPQLTLWDQKARFEFCRAAWCLCKRLARRDAPLELDLPKEYPLWRQDGRYDAGELADWFHTQALEIARAFGARDGYPYFAQALERAGCFL